MDPQLWERTGGDPVRMLADVSVERLQALSIDKRFIKNLRRLRLILPTIWPAITGIRAMQPRTLQPR